MRGCAVWAQLSESDFENAKEAMEKLVMNRSVANAAKRSVQGDDEQRLTGPDLARPPLQAVQLHLHARRGQGGEMEPADRRFGAGSCAEGAYRAVQLVAGGAS